MPTQKVFKQRVRARMTKTGESYTAARRQLLHKTAEPAATTEPAAPPRTPAPSRRAATTASADAFVVADESMLRATGKTHAEWFALLDAWGATDHSHTEIARWLSETQGVPGWWTQSMTVAYERARGMRARHQMADGFSVSATRTVAVAPERALAAFTDARPRRAGSRTPRCANARPARRTRRRFDWADPPSRVVVTVVPKGPDKTVVAVGARAAARRRDRRTAQGSLARMARR